MAAAAAGGMAVGLRGLLTGRGSAASSGADRRARHGVQLLRHSPRGGGGRLQLFDQRDVFGGVLVAEGKGGGRRRLSALSPGVGAHHTGGEPM